MTATSNLLKVTRQRKGAASVQLPAGHDLRTVRDAFVVVRAEMGENIGSSAWERLLFIGCIYVGTFHQEPCNDHVQPTAWLAASAWFAGLPAQLCSRFTANAGRCRQLTPLTENAAVMTFVCPPRQRMF